MKTLEELIEARKRTTDRAEYDRLSLQIAKAEGDLNFAESKRQAEIAAAKAKERATALADHMTRVDNLHRLYATSTTVDEKILASCESFIRLCMQRINLEDLIRESEYSTAQNAGELGIPSEIPLHRPEAMIGGTLVRMNHENSNSRAPMNTVVGTWLQRVSDSIANGEPIREGIQRDHRDPGDHSIREAKLFERS